MRNQETYAMYEKGMEYMDEEQGNPETIGGHSNQRQMKDRANE